MPFDSPAHIFTGTSFPDIRRRAVEEISMFYGADASQLGEGTLRHGIIFNVDRLEDCVPFSAEEVTIGELKALVVIPRDQKIRSYIHDL